MKQCFAQILEFGCLWNSDSTGINIYCVPRNSAKTYCLILIGGTIWKANFWTTCSVRNIEPAKTSSVSGVNSPQVISPAMPVTPDHWHTPQSCLMSSTSRKDSLRTSPGWFLTPVQCFLNNVWKVKNKELKYNWPQPNYPEPQSVLRNRTRSGNKRWNFTLCNFLYLALLLRFSATDWTGFVLSFHFFRNLDPYANCHKIYPNCIWHLPLRWHALNYNSVLLLKVSWYHSTNVVRVCITPLSPTTS